MDVYNEIKIFLPIKWAKYGDRHPNNQMKVVVFSTLEQVVTALKRHDVFLKDSIKYCNPLDSLFSEDEWSLIKLNMAELPTTIEPLLRELSISLEESYRKVIDTWENNKWCRLEKIKGKNRLILKNISKSLETDSIVDLKKNIVDLMPPIDIPDLMLEAD